MKKIILALFTFGLLLSCNSKPIAYCQNLENVVKNDEVINRLIKWFDNEFSGKLIPKENYRFGGLYVPGMYTYQEDFDWNFLNFDEKSTRVKILNLYTENIDESGLISVDKVFLAERSRAGILIKLDKSISVLSGTDGKHITEITDRVAIICGED